MPTKIFTIMGGDCPFGRGCEIDSQVCRKCEHYYRAGTGTFFWCKHPDGDKRGQKERKRPAIEQNTRGIERKSPETEQPKRKRGRPPGKSTTAGKTPAKRGRKPTKGKERPIMVIKQVKR